MAFPERQEGRARGLQDQNMYEWGLVRWLRGAKATCYEDWRPEWDPLVMFR